MLRGRSSAVRRFGVPAVGARYDAAVTGEDGAETGEEAVPGDSAPLEARAVPRKKAVGGKKAVPGEEASLGPPAVASVDGPAVAPLDEPAVAADPPAVAPPAPSVTAEGPAVPDPICPYLGMVGDQNGHHSFPSRLHLCHAGEPAHIGLGFQADYCLGGAYPSCARYQRAEEAAAAERAATGLTTATLTDGSMSAAALAPVPAGSGRLGRVRGPDERGRGSSRLVSVLLGLALISTLVAFAVAAGFIKLPTGGPIAVGPTPTAAVTLSPTQLPTETLAPTASPTPAPTPVPTPSASAATGEVLHVVQPGETLTSISLFYHVAIEAIVARNGITDPNSIVAGQTLVIPLGAASPSSTGQATPTTTGPPTATPKPTKTPAPTSFVYVVKQGDTLSSIADQFHVSVQALLDVNPDITDPNKIFVGQQIIIPGP